MCQCGMWNDTLNYLLIFSLKDPRVKGWPLVDSIWYPVGIVALYVSVVIIGPKIMKNRQAFEMKFAMALHNFVAVALSLYMFLKVSLSYSIISIQESCGTGSA